MGCTHMPMLIQELLSLTLTVPSFLLILLRSMLPRLPMLRLEVLFTPLDTMPMDLQDSLPTPTVPLSLSSPLMSLPPELNTSRPTLALKQNDSQTKKTPPVRQKIHP